jgi:hypothetical protein
LNYWSLKKLGDFGFILDINATWIKPQQAGNKAWGCFQWLLLVLKFSLALRHLAVWSLHHQVALARAFRDWSEAPRWVSAQAGSAGEAGSTTVVVMGTPQTVPLLLGYQHLREAL